MAARQQRSGAVTEVISDRGGRYRFVGVPDGGALLQIVTDEDNHRQREAVAPFDVEPGKTYSFDIVAEGG